MMSLPVQAHYYETMEDCPSGAEPDFSVGPQQLLFRLNTALAEAGNFNRLSSANLTLTITVATCISSIDFMIRASFTM